MTTLKVKADDYNVYDIERICRSLSKSYGWDLPYTLNADRTVSFSIGGATFKGEFAGHDFLYSDTMGTGQGCLNWLDSVGGSFSVLATAPDGEEVFLVLGND